MKPKSLDELREFLKGATIRKEPVKRGAKEYGPYLRACKKVDGKLRWVYIGKSMDDLGKRLQTGEKAKSMGMSSTTYKKVQRIHSQYELGDPVAKKYIEMNKKKGCNLDWAYRKVREHYREACNKVRDRTYGHGLDLDEAELQSYLISELRKLPNC